MRRLAQGALLGILAAIVPASHGQTPPTWEQTKYFRYDIHNVAVAAGPTAGSWTVKVMFSVSNPEAGGTLWDIRTAAPFSVANGGGFNLDIAWSGAEFTNTGSAGATLAPIVGTALGSGAASPVQVRTLQSTATKCTSADDCPGVDSQQLVMSYWVSKTVTPVPATVATGRVALEGRPVCVDLPGCPTATAPYANIPVRSATADFAFVASNAALIKNPRRQVVDIAKCKACHDDQKHGDTVVPRLSLHGANRNENLDLCVVCHNPNQTDVPYRFASPTDPRIGAAETPIDFKTMVHSIHAGGFRKTPFVVIGRNSSVNDFSDVRFPAELRKSCLKCHVVDASGKGSFELPLKSTVLGTTVKTQSTYQVAAGATRTIDVNPANDLKITPTAATCSACHDNSEVRSHMIRTGGASFGTTQDRIGTTVKERCVSCHGPGKDKDVRKVHELSGSSRD
jgi:OmcA/MtrC family decaheme c-type cytochrome